MMYSMTPEVAKVVHEAIRQQRDYCKRHDVPLFAPGDGVCFKCHNQIYAGPAAIPPEIAATTLVTGCPYCLRSFVD